MAYNPKIMDEIDSLISDRCRSAQRRLEETKPDLLHAIEYNDRLADNWEPGIKTRSSELEQHELEKFIQMMDSSWLDDRRHPARPENRALIIDLGAGNGKVVDWVAALIEKTPCEVSCIFTDISSKMMDSAERRFQAMQADHPGSKTHGHFTLCDITEPMFSAGDWQKLRKAFFPIITVCAGGTIGNFGEIDAADDAAQKMVFDHYVWPADAALVTFLDPHRIKTSLEAYASSGTTSGMYDGQVVSAYVMAGEDNRSVKTWTVPFRGNGEKTRIMDQVVGEAGKLEGKPFWLKMDMIQDGKRVGQVTRHYSEKYAKERFLGRAEVHDIEPNGRAFTVTFGDASVERR